MNKHQDGHGPFDPRGIAADLAGVGPVQVRRGTLFLVNIGIPVLAGLLAGDPQWALAGAVLGMCLAFADNDGPLRSRLRLLVWDAAAIGLGGLAGYLSRDSTAALWPIFVAITLAVGMAARAGREPLLAGRHGAMAFTVAAAIPAFTPNELWFLAGVVALNAVSRVLDHWLCGPLPRQQATPLQMPSGYAGWLRFAIAFAGAATASLWIGGTLDPMHRIWVVTTTLVVMQPDARASFLRIVERIAGTFAGVVGAWGITIAFHSAEVIGGAILVVAPLIPHHLAKRYWLHTGLIALMVLLAYDLTELNAQGMSDLLIERVKDILLGCTMALVGTAVAFPREAAAELDAIVDDSG
jgi:uncharacterized membrane protein YccC